MKPTESQQSSNPATPIGILRDMLKMRAKRCCLVRKADAGQPPGVAIFLLDSASIRAVGPYLESVFRENPQPPNTKVITDQDGKISLIMEAMEQAGQQWTWQTLRFPTPPGVNSAPAEDGMMVFLVGKIVTKQLAKKLTKLGVICNLN